MPSAYIQEYMVNAYALRDVALHDPTTDATVFIVLDVHTYSGVIVKIRNGLDQIARVQVMGNLGRDAMAVSTAAVSFPDRVGAPIDVQSGDSESRSMSIYDGSLPPIIYCQITALVLPTSGTISVEIECSGQNPGFA